MAPSRSVKRRVATWTTACAASIALMFACSRAPTSPPGTADDMVLVPAGRFVRGHASAERADETPAHVAVLAAYAIDRTLVTRAQFGRFVEVTGYVTSAEEAGYGIASQEGMRDWEWERVPGASWRRPFVVDSSGEPDADARTFLLPDAPVVMVSWLDAVAFCAHAGKRLPTEAEWEHAMRAGTGSARYPWGETPERDGRLALNFWQGTSHRANLRDDGYVYVSPVRAFPPNPWGIHDPVGNVWQWTADWYAPDTYARAAANGAVVDPRGPDAGKERVLRGGSWWCGACACEGNGLFYRGKAAPTAAFNNNGFRCAR